MFKLNKSSFILIFLSILFSQYTLANCSSPSSPFLVSSATKQGNRIFENLRSIDNPNVKTKYLPRQSIVKSLLKDGFSRNKHYHPIEVLTVPHLIREKYISKSRNDIRNLLKTNKERAEENDQAYIHRDSLLSAYKFEYVLKDNQLINIGQKDDDIIVLKPSRKNSKYITQCNGTGYYFDVLIKRSSKDIKKEPILIDLDSSEGLELIKNIIVLPRDSSKVILKILQYIQMDSNFEEYSADNFEYLQTLKLIKFPIDYETLESPFSSYYYGPDNKGRDDAYINPLAGCALLSVLKKYNDKFGDNENSVAVGDMYHPRSWGDHATHGGGQCVDIRPIRKDGEQGSLYYTNTAAYDQKATINFVKLLKKAGGTKIYFNDPKVRKAVSGVSKKGGHNNHIHVCFPNTKKVRKACFN